MVSADLIMQFDKISSTLAGASQATVPMTRVFQIDLSSASACNSHASLCKSGSKVIWSGR